MLKLENGILFLLAFTLFVYFGYPFFYFFIFLLLPDMMMIGYLRSPALGAGIYNLGHTLVFPVVLIFIYLFTHMSFLLPIAIVWCAHIFMDRTLGYGLKYPGAFNHTHIQNL
ncbi:DUF4260 family protein [Enterococcus sp. DIV0849a]|uniref:DUF4260 family protein n=1 Tax=Enterococcus sp. DIV0849a TaxID=2230879 RepID=UPI001A8E6E7B|nr:DUF4260 family protein [Enterococcus sp. DIV0849a]